MTRRLHLAGMGLCAFLMPACSSFERAEPVSSTMATAPGYVLMDRNGKPMPANQRLQRMEGASAPATLDTSARKTTPPVFPADKPDDLAKAVDAALAPPPNPLIIPARHEKAMPVETPAVENLLVQSQKSWPFPQPESALIAPAWPSFGGTSETPPAPPAETKNAFALPPVAEIEAPKIVEPNVSLKLPEPMATPQAALQAPPLAALPAPAPLMSGSETVLLQAIKAFQNNRPQEALDCLKTLDSTNQELLMYLMPLMVRLSDGKNASLPPEELAMLVDRLQTASGMLKSKASLQMDRVCFCRGVRKFADLDQYPAGHEFHPGDMVFLYAELKNFTCEPVTTQPAAGYNAQTRGCNVRLTTTLELRDAKQNLIWRTDLNKTDHSLTPPQDYYHTYRFCIPEKLPAGTYTLWVNILDKPSGRAVRKPVEMRVGQS